MKSQKTKLAAFAAAAAMVTFATAAPADAASIGRNIPDPCAAYVAGCQRLNANPELCQHLFDWAESHGGEWASPDALNNAAQVGGHPFKHPPHYRICTP
jgi:hypothetical protein